MVATRAGTTFYNRHVSISDERASKCGPEKICSSIWLGTYQETRPTYETHEIVTLCYACRFFDRHGCSAATVNVWMRSGIASQIANLTKVIAKENRVLDWKVSTQCRFEGPKGAYNLVASSSALYKYLDCKT